MRKNRFGTCFLALLLAVFMLAGTLTGCTRELTETQSAALVALQNAVSYYETTGHLNDWQDLVTLAAANRADGIGINWNALTLPETPQVPAAVPATVLPAVSSAVPPTDQDAGTESAADGAAVVPWTPMDVSAYPGAIISSIIKGEEYKSMADDLLAGQNPDTGAFTTSNISQHIWSMITLTTAVGKDGYDYDKAVSYLLTYQREDGGFGYAADATASDIKLTGEASIALAPYYEKHKKSVEMKALLSFYEEGLTADGGYEGFDGEDVSAVASAIGGLTALNLTMPVTEEGLTPITTLLSYQNEDGSFRLHKDGEHVANAAATQQATLALCDVVNDVNSYTLLAADAESYRIENLSGPAITLSIDFPEESDAADVSTPFIVEEGSTALDALLLYGKLKEIPIAFSGKKEQRVVQSVNGVSEKAFGENSGWICKVNDQMTPLNPALFMLRDGDVLSWIYVTNIDETIME